MKIAVSSQNFRTITGHAGRARRFLVYEVGAGSTVTELERIDLPIEGAMHGFDDRQPHPLDQASVLITGGAGDGFVQRMLRRGVRVAVTGETDPEKAVHAFLAGCLKRPTAQDAACDSGSGHALDAHRTHDGRH